MPNLRVRIKGASRPHQSDALTASSRVRLLSLGNVNGITLWCANSRERLMCGSEAADLPARRVACIQLARCQRIAHRCAVIVLHRCQVTHPTSMIVTSVYAGTDAKSPAQPQSSAFKTAENGVMHLSTTATWFCPVSGADCNECRAWARTR